MCGDSQDPIQLHPGANVYEIDFRAGGGPLNSGEKVGSVHSLSVLRSLVAVSGGSAVLPFAKTESKVKISYLSITRSYSYSQNTSFPISIPWGTKVGGLLQT